MKTTTWIALLGLALASFLGLLDLTIVNTALPEIQSELNVGVSQLQWVMTSLLLALTASMVTLGKLADLHGRRRFLYIGLALFGIASLGAGWAPNIHVLVLSRFIQGLGIALLYTTPLAILPSIVPPDQQGKATGILVGISSLGLAMGPALGGVILSTLGWRWLFFINPPIVALCFLLCWNTLPESKNQTATGNLDWAGFLLLSVSIPLLILGIVNSQALAFLNPQVIGFIVAAVTGLFALVLVEQRATSPVIQFSLLTRHDFLVGLVANFSLAAFYAIDFFLIPLYLHYVRGQSGDEIGFTLLPATLMLALWSPLAGRLVDKKGPRTALMLGLTLLSVSALLQTQFNAHTPLWAVIGTYLLFGSGWAWILSPSITAAISSVPADSGGVAAGTLGTFHNFGGAMGLVVGTLIFSAAAYTRLTSLVTDRHIDGGPWLSAAVSNTDQAVNIIASNTGLNQPDATDLFHQFFLHGYASAMWLLVLLPLLSLGFLSLSGKKKTRPVSE